MSKPPQSAMPYLPHPKKLHKSTLCFLSFSDTTHIHLTLRIIIIILIIIIIIIIILIIIIIILLIIIIIINQGATKPWKQWQEARWGFTYPVAERQMCNLGCYGCRHIRQIVHRTDKFVCWCCSRAGCFKKGGKVQLFARHLHFCTTRMWNHWCLVRRRRWFSEWIR